MSYLSACLKFFTLALLTVSALSAQAVGVVRGQVLDSSGASVPQAKITVTGPGNVVRAAQTDESGAFSVPGLPTGEYVVRALAPGFTVVEKKTTVNTGQVATLDFQLAVTLERQQVTVADQVQVDVDPANNASALVLRGDDLNTLSDNPADMLTDLQALAGPAAGPNGGQIFVDGFSNGQLPPKESIREVRLNSNPFSAEFDRSGMGRIEIFTRPGADKLRGNVGFNFADSILNTRNPFSPIKPPTQMRSYQMNIGGPLSKKASFTVDAAKSTQDASGLINAQVLDASLRPIEIVENVLTPTRFDFISPRFDYALSPSLTLQARYTRNVNSNENSGVGGFSLASRATDSENSNHTVQFTATKVIGTRLINESRFQFNRNRNDNTGDASLPSLNVLSSFNGGGANLSHNYNLGRGYELQNNSSYARGTHVVRFGVRVRGAWQDSYSTSNYNGSFTFTSMDSYIATLRGIQQGLSFDEIRAQGGGARQYSVTGGTPLTTVSMTDAAPFIQDDWRLKPTLTLSLGMRYELQSNIDNTGAWAPRLGIAWGFGKGRGPGAPPKTVLRLGTGFFYERIGQGLTLQTLRQNGITQQNFFIESPSFYNVVPPVSQLLSARQPQAIYLMDSGIQAPQVYQSAMTIERQLPKNMTVSLNYTRTRGIHQLRSRNINAPLPGARNPDGGAIHPYGGSGQLFLYESSAQYKQNQIILIVNARINPKYSLFGYYGFNKSSSNSDGAGSFPANNYDLSGEWGRASFDWRHRAHIGGNLALPFKFQVSPTLNLFSGGPVNITTGTDLNRDTNFNDRPAFATVAADPSKGVIASQWGTFNIDPVRHPEYGSAIIPRNYGAGYGFFGVFVRLTRSWTFGESAAPARPAGAPSAPAGPGRYRIELSVSSRNALNHRNPAPPVTNMSSPFFGQALQSVYGGNANRRTELGVRFSF